MRSAYNTNLKRSALALLIGAAVGGPLSILTVFAPSLLANGTGGFSVSDFTSQIVFASAAATVVFAVGLVLFAIPCWVLLHRAGFRSWRSAVVLGAALGFVATILLNVMPPSLPQAPGSYYSYGGSEGLIIDRNFITPLGWKTFFVNASIQGAVCALVGLLIWAIAYRRNA